jgi:hypothetical protein
VAIAFVANGGYASSATTTVILNKPAGIAVGNLMVAFVTAQDTNQTATVTTLSGWTLAFGPQHVTLSGVGLAFYAFTRVATSADVSGSTYSWTAVNGTGTLHGIDGLIYGFSGTATSSPVNHAAGAVAVSTSVTIPTFGGAETFVSGEWYVACCCDAFNNVPTTITPALTNVSSNAGTNEAFYVGTLTSLVASPGTQVFTQASFSPNLTCGIGLTILPLSAAVVQKQIDSELLVWAKVPSPETRTAFQPGFISHGAKAPTGPIAADLPPLGRGPSIDLRTAFQSGQHGLPIGLPIDAALPPVLARLSIDLRTSYQAGSHGATAQTQNQTELPPIRARSSPDLLTWTIAGKVTAVFIPLTYDTSLPPLSRALPIDLRTSYQPGSHGAAAGPIDALLPPLGRGPSIDLRTSYQDGFITHGAPVSGPIDASLPTPRRLFSFDNYTGIVAGKVTLQSIAAVPGDTSLPPTKLRQHPSLLPAFTGGFVGDPIATQPQWMGDNALPPKGRGPAIDLLTWVVSGRVTAVLGVQAPAYDTSLPPRSRPLPPDAGTWFQPGYVSAGAQAQWQYDHALPPYDY